MVPDVQPHQCDPPPCPMLSHASRAQVMMWFTMLTTSVKNSFGLVLSCFDSPSLAIQHLERPALSAPAPASFSLPRRLVVFPFQASFWQAAAGKDRRFINHLHNYPQPLWANTQNYKCSLIGLGLPQRSWNKPFSSTCNGKHALILQDPVVCQINSGSVTVDGEIAFSFSSVITKSDVLFLPVVLCCTHLELWVCLVPVGSHQLASSNIILVTY